MAGPNKTHRSASASAAGRPQAIGAQKLFIPCNAGRNAYVYDVATGKNPNLAVGSPQFVAAVAKNVEAGHGAKVREELIALAERFPADGWDATLANLEAEGVLPAA